MSDNVDVYRKILFRPPRPRRAAALLLVLGVLFGAASAAALSPSSSLTVTLAGAGLAAVLFYILPAVLSAEVTAWSSQIGRRWTYLMSVVDQVILFLFSLTIPFTDSAAEAWQVMWLGLATIYLVNLVMVLMVRGRRDLHWNLVHALLYPGSVLLAFHLAIGRLVGIPRTLYLRNSMLILASAFLLLLTFGLYDFLIRANVDLSTFEFTSTLLLDEPRRLDGGVTTDVYHQALHVSNHADHTFTIPWVHPGPVAGFGGGMLAPELIDDDTFLLHVPSYHTLDLADPAAVDRFRDPPDADTNGTASRLLTVEADGFTLWGRRYAGGTVVYVQNRGIDDYEPSIAYDLKEEYPGLCLVDLHNQTLGEGDQWLQHMDADARVLEDAVADLVEQLEDADMYDYHAGVAGGERYRCLMEEVDGQTTCLLGVNASDAPPALHDAAAAVDADHVLPFTTDSHENLVQMSSPDFTAAELQQAVTAAQQDLADAAAGIGERVEEDVTVLGKDYEGLITTLNVMARLVPITLVLYYIGIIFLIL